MFSVIVYSYGKKIIGDIVIGIGELRNRLLTRAEIVLLWFSACQELSLAQQKYRARNRLIEHERGATG